MLGEKERLQMKKDRRNQKREHDTIEATGKIIKILNGMMYRIQLDNGIEIIGHLSGKMRQFNIKISLGDSVRCELSPYDLTKGRITYRIKE